MKKSFASNKALNSYIKDFKESVQNLRRYKGSLTKRVKAVTSNPVATFRFIRRIVNDLPELKLRMKQYDELFEDFPRTWPWLTYDDLDDAMLTIIKINYFYNLDAESVQLQIER
ncbi:unnamed protein product [Allacma fusca]|uniref:Prolyl 4-hydroxylase N-terminal domain-containing protein n=1 Tax=Allacma fusca TaxID=39272 RepID=A0A8J2L402_9HEXA|nr:unnamed protein product [Allacma fusca]